jgi:secondary thiamine-phosphate synthase enzyme
MKILSHLLHIQTGGFSDVCDLTPQLSAWLGKAGVSDGLLTVFVPGSTAGVTTIECEEGAVEDLKAALERIAPQEIQYRHDARWGDGNGFSHIRASLLGPSLSIPLQKGRLALGTWQQVVCVDCDNRPRRREIVVHLIGE